MTPYRIDLSQSPAAGSRPAGCGSRSHFVAMGEPLAHAADIRAFFADLR